MNSGRYLLKIYLSQDIRPFCVGERCVKIFKGHSHNFEKVRPIIGKVTFFLFQAHVEACLIDCLLMKNYLKWQPIFFKFGFVMCSMNCSLYLKKTQKAEQFSHAKMTVASCLIEPVALRLVAGRCNGLGWQFGQERLRLGRCLKVG